MDEALRSEFTLQDKSLIKETILKNLRIGATISDAIKIAAARVQKDEKKVHNVWYNKIYHKHGKEIAEAKEAGRTYLKDSSIPKLNVKMYKGGRKSAWTSQQDDMIASVMLSYVNTPAPHGTWAQISSMVGFPPKKCEGRWQVLKKHYIGKEARITMAKTVQTEAELVTSATNLSIKEIVTNLDQYLKNIEQEVVRLNTSENRLLKQVKVLEDENKRLKAGDLSKRELEAQNEALQEQLTKRNRELAELESNHKAVLQIFDRARKMQVNEDLGEHEKSKFKMDSNGNLERL